MTAPDLTTYRIVHRGLRHGAHRLAAAGARLDPTDARRVAAFAAYWRGYAGEVLHHHGVEDDVFFPALVETVAVGAEALEAIGGDHEHLDVLMDAITARIAELETGGGTEELCRLLAELADHMETHLAVEDADLLPLFERHFTAEAYEALEAQALEDVGLGKQAFFTVPFIVGSATPAERFRLLADAPLPLRVVYRLTRRRHARLVLAALGPEPAEDAGDAVVIRAVAA